MKKQYIETAKDTALRLTQTDAFLSQGVAECTITVNEKRTYQEMIGFGGAFTESATYTMSRMSKENRDKVLRSYYHPTEGIGYNIGRIPIHSCDFALGNYTYVDEEDTDLESFDISHEHQWMLPFIKDAYAMRGKPIHLLASPWSPPAWMKDNNEMNHGGKLLPEYYETWARYYTKFIKAMQQEGMEIFAITVQNEPAAKQVWDSCEYTAEEERNFVRDYLGPIMEEEGLSDIKIFIWDHNRDIVLERASVVFDDPKASRYVYGTGIHWYVSEDFENVGKVHDAYPDKHILFTEGCQEGGVHIGAWDTGERYGRNMIGDFNNWCEGYLDWNIVLDETGGPNHVNNLCDAPIIADTQTDKLIFNSSFYYIGQFSKFVQEGAKRIHIEAENTGLLHIAFINPDASIVVVMQNESDRNKTVELQIKGEPFVVTVRARGIGTVVVQ